MRGVNHRIKGTYPANWREIARAAKERVSNRCERCGHPDEPPWKIAKLIPMWQSRTGSKQTGASPCDELCTHPKNGKQRILTVHHIDGDKGNCADWNLAVLCQACHLTIQGRVNPFQDYMLVMSKWFVPHYEGMKQAIARKEWP